MRASAADQLRVATHDAQALGQLQVAAARPAPTLYTVDELAALLRVDPSSIYTWVCTAPERLPRAKRLAGRILFPPTGVHGR